MAVNIKYRAPNPVVHTDTTIKNSPLSNEEIDGNFKNVKDAIEVIQSADGAAAVGFTPTGTVAATNVQSAINEVVSDLAAGTGASLVGYVPAGTGAVATTVQSKLRETVSVFDFMTTAQIADVQAGTKTLDVTSAIQSALDYCKNNGAKLIGQPGIYRTSATLNIVCDADMGQMLISCPGATVAVAVRIGTTTGTNSEEIINLQVIAPKVVNSSKTGLGWSGFKNSVGIELANLYTSQITIGDVRNFGIGVRVGGYTQGCAYNSIYFGILFDNLVTLLLQKQGASGVSNQNTFYGGQYGKTGAEGTLIPDAYAIFCDTSTNNNTFINPSTEADGDLFQYYFRNSSFNTIVNPRFEIPDGGRVCFDSSSVGGIDSNVFINGYSFNAPNFTYAGVGTSVNNKFVGQKYGDYYGYASKGMAINNLFGDGPTAPHITGYSATVNLLSKDPAVANDYTYKLFANGLYGKRITHTQPAMHLDWDSGKIRLGDGANPLSAAALSCYPTLNWMAVENATAFTPIPDNSTTLGTAAYRWSTVFAATGAINTSDERDKQDIASLEAAELRVAKTLKSLVKKFRFKDSVQTKGDGARIHVGVIAQEVIAAFLAEGLDPTRYSIVCYDEWEELPEYRDDEGNITRPGKAAGNRYGIRYEELISFILAAL